MKQWGMYRVAENTALENGVFELCVAWHGGTPPRAGQFFLIRPKRSATLLGRPISVAGFSPYSGGMLLRFLIMRVGTGTGELSETRAGEEVALTGPLGNCWADFLPDRGGKEKKTALVSGGLGVAPLLLFTAELEPDSFDFYAGFKHDSPSLIRRIERSPNKPSKISVSVESMGGTEGKFITDYLRVEEYGAVFACGPRALLQNLSALCGKAQTPCFISMESRMACGAGACLGCSIQTRRGNKRCCADGPIFRAEEVVF
jgi:NAD(P)H-flavin reductase